MVQCNSGQIFSWSFNTSLKCFISSVSFPISLFREVFSCSRDSYSWKEGKSKKKKIQLTVKTFLSVLPPWVHSHNCINTVWFLTTTHKLLRKDRHSMGAGTGQVLYNLCPDHAAIPVMALRTRRCCWPSGLPQKPRAAGMDGCVPMVASSTLGCLCWEAPKWTLHCEITENESTDCWEVLENTEPGTAGERRAAPTPGQCREKPFIQASTTSPLLSSRPDRACSLLLRSPRTQEEESIMPAWCQTHFFTRRPDYCLGYPWPSCFWAKASLAINRLLLTAGKF